MTNNKLFSLLSCVKVYEQIKELFVVERERERETAFGEGKESYGIREGIKRSWACGEEKRGAYKVAVFASLSANRKARIQCTWAFCQRRFWLLERVCLCLLFV